MTFAVGNQNSCKNLHLSCKENAEIDARLRPFGNFTAAKRSSGRTLDVSEDAAGGDKGEGSGRECLLCGSRFRAVEMQAKSLNPGA